MVTSISIPTKIGIIQYNDIITKGISKVLTFVKSMDRIYDVPSAEAEAAASVNQGHTNSSQPGLIVGTICYKHWLKYCLCY